MKRLNNFLGGFLFITLLSMTFGCSKRTETVLTGAGDVVNPPVPCTSTLFGTLTRESTGDVTTNTDVIFRVTASGCSGRYQVFVNGQSTINFTGSNTVFVKRYTAAASNYVESVTLVDANDVTKSIVLSAQAFNIVAGSSTGACSVVISPNFLNVNLDQNGNIVTPLPQIQVQVRENANAPIILTELKDEVTGRAPVQWLNADTALASLQQLQISPSVPGNHVVTAKFKTSASGAVAGTCQAYYELRANQSNSCTITANPADVDVGQNLTFTLTSPPTTSRAFIDGFEVPVGSAQVVVRAANPGNWNVRGHLYDSAGRLTGQCWAPYRVKAPEIATFTMNGIPTDAVSVKSSQPVLVQWTSANADSCVINPGGHTGLSGQVSFANLAAGVTHYYALVCTKGANQASKTFAINVLPAVPIYKNTPSARCNWGQVPSETTAPVYFGYCDYTYRDDCNGSNPSINNNIIEEINLGTCRQIACTTSMTSGKKYGRYRCQGTSVIIRYE